MPSPIRIGLLLTDDFALMSYAAAIEPFRAANIIAGRALYSWRHISLDGAPARASNGAALAVDGRLGEGDFDLVFVFMAGRPASFRHAPTFAWLRRLARQGVRLAGVSGGAYALARAGLLQGYRVTIHWEHRAAFTEAFPELQVARSLYEIDRGRLTCAGGVAALDMVLALIEEDHGSALAASVGDWFIRAQPRSGSDDQRQALRDRYGTSDEKVLGALAWMEARIDEPLDRKAIGAKAGVTTRQMERLFLSRLGTPMGRVHLAMRLDAARRLVRQTAMPVLDIAVSCGFSSTSHFSRTYRARHGVAPSVDRGQLHGG